jgi:hypothetical protein
VTAQEHLAGIQNQCPALGATAGRCGELTFVSHSTGFTSATYFFEADGALLAIDVQSDALEAPCLGKWRYGVRPACEPTNVRIVCSRR